MLINTEYTMTNDQENITEDDLMYITFNSNLEKLNLNKLNILNLFKVKQIRKMLNKYCLTNKLNIYQLFNSLSHFLNIQIDQKITNNDKIKIIEYFDSINLQFIDIDQMLKGNDKIFKKKILVLKFSFDKFERKFKKGNYMICI